MEDSKRMAKRGPRENYPCILIQPIFLNFLLVYEPSNFLLSVPKANHWIHVRGWVWVVTSYSYWAHGGWVQSSWGNVWVKQVRQREENGQEGSKGNYPCILIQLIFPNLLLVYEPSNFWLSVPKDNHWIHVRGWVWVFTSQIYWAHGDWVQLDWGSVRVKQASQRKGNPHRKLQQF